MQFTLRHLNRSRALNGLAAIAVLFGMCWGILHAINLDPARSPLATVLAVGTHGLSGHGTDFFASPKPGAGPAIVSAMMPLEPEADYLASVQVRTPPRVPAEMQVDLFAPGYDNPEQEVSVVLKPSDKGRTVRVRLDAGSQPPPQAELRIIYSGSESFEFGNVRVARLPGWRSFLESVSGTLALLFAIAAAVMFGSMYSAGVNADSTSRRGGARMVAALGVMVATASALRLWISSQVPYWSGDELVYKVIASGIWADGRAGIPVADQVAHQTNLPNMVYPYVIAPAFALGNSFYDGVRLINAIAIGMTCVPVYLIARRFLTPPLSMLSAVASVALPSSFLGAFAVTEPVYYPIFMVAVLLGLRSIEESQRWTRGIAFGLALGLLLNVRLNGIVLAPAWAIVVGYKLVMAPDTASRARVVCGLLAGLVTTVLIYYGVKLALAPVDSTGLGFYENRSGGWVSTALSVALSDPKGLAILMLGHMAILAVPFSLGIAGALGLILSGGLQSTDRRGIGAAFLLLLTAGSVAFAIVFTLGVSPVDLGGLGRWHSRYYFGIFPLLILLSFAGLHPTPVSLGARKAIVAVVVVFIAALLLFVLILNLSANPWFGATVDSMEVHWIRFWRLPIVLLCLGIFLAACLWGRRLGTGLAVATCICWLMVANLGTLKELQRMPTRLDPHCGQIMQSEFQLDSSRTAIVVSERRFLADNLFWISGVPARSLVLGRGQSIDAGTLKGISYVLSDSAIRVHGASTTSAIGECNLYKVN